MSIRTHAASLLLVLAAAGCSLPQAAIPDDELRPSASASSQASLPPDATPQAGLAAIEACKLLTAEEATSLGVPPQGRPEEIVGLRRCDWGGAEGGVSTGINGGLGIDGLNLADASSVADVTIGRHQAKRAVEGSGPGYCEVIFAVGNSANVAVTALYLNDTSRACAAADQAAAFVEPKLP
ncbi:MAG: DUF3558 family protein [Pseudonocardiaceae bacterium]